ncbi:GGDEF-domain containing protein, partial [Streptomyces sp. NPDC000851]
MEPTESAAPYSRLRRMAGAWRGGLRTALRADAQASDRAVDRPTAADGYDPARTAGLPGADAERHPHLTWPALPAAVVAAAGFALGAGFLRAFTG